MDERLTGIVARTADTLARVGGVKAIVLGGSHATGTAGPTSDIDIGIYYDSKAGLDMASLRLAAAQLDDGKDEGVVTEPGKWGKWINGGGWLTIDGAPVDLLYRDLEKVESVISDCLNGKITIEYQRSHPFGFVNSIYMGEVHYCKVLRVNGDELPKLKELTEPFPARYKEAAIAMFIREAEFSLMCGRKSVHSRDAVYAAGSLYRSVNSLIQALFAVNHMYLLNEKGSLARLNASAAWLPSGFVREMEQLFTNLNADDLEPSFKLVEGFMEEIRLYQARR